MPVDRISALDALVRAALSVGDVRSAAIFVPATTPGAMTLAAAAGIDGAALDGLVAAVQQPTHPVATALHDDAPTFDILPINPGGPRLRSHLPVRHAGNERVSGGTALGVLALAHDSALTPAERERVVALGGRAADLLEAPADRIDA